MPNRYNQFRMTKKPDDLLRSALTAGIGKRCLRGVCSTLVGRARFGISHLADSPQDPREGQVGREAPAQPRLQDTDVAQHGVAHAVVAPHS